MQTSTCFGAHGVFQNFVSLRLRLALLIIATAQLMLVLDDTIVNIALASIQREFTISSSVLP